MLFAYCEDGTLEVVADEVEARRQFEGYDVESGAVRLFDAAGNALMPVFPERSERKFLGIRISDDPGPFELVPSAERGTTSLQEAFGPSVVLMPNRWFKDLGAVRTHLSTTR
jgi:hypothetical protein